MGIGVGAPIAGEARVGSGEGDGDLSTPTDQRLPANWLDTQGRRRGCTEWGLFFKKKTNKGFFSENKWGCLTRS